MPGLRPEEVAGRLLPSTQRVVYIHQLPQTAPRLAGVIEGVFGPAARDGRAMSAGRRAEGTWRETRPSNPPEWAAQDCISTAQGGCGRDRIRTCVGNAGDLQVAPPLPRGSRRLPARSRSSPVTCANGGLTAPPSLGVPASFARSCAAERRAEGSRRESPGCHLPEFPTYFLSRVQS